MLGRKVTDPKWVAALPKRLEITLRFPLGFFIKPRQKFTRGFFNCKVLKMKEIKVTHKYVSSTNNSLAEYLGDNMPHLPQFKQYERRYSMKKKLTKPIKFLSLIIEVIGITLFISIGSVFAEESSLIPVSCTIPAVPGVNVPLSTAEEAQEAVIDQQAATLIIQESLEQRILTADGKTGLIAIQTIYSR